MKRLILIIALLLAPLSAAWTAQETTEPGTIESGQDLQPEPATGWTPKEAVEARNFMVAAANPLAVMAGVEILKEGGSAADAMIATQLVLNLVEPQSSGIGGGAFLVYYDVGTGSTTTFDGRETAPLAARGDLFLTDSGEEMSFRDAVVGGLSVGTPGTLKLLETVHRRYGKLPWDRLFGPAISLAENGFEVSPRLAGLLSGAEGEALRTFDEARNYFFPNGRALEAGERIRNPDFAETLKIIARDGSAPFYTGEIGRDIVATVRGAPRNPGLLSEEDLAGYRVVERPPVCEQYRGFDVCGMGPPSSGGLTVGQILQILEHFPIGQLSPADPTAWHLFAEASKLAYADRDLYMADADFVPVPSEGLLDDTYLMIRAQEIRPDRAMEVPVRAGNPPWHNGPALAPDRSQERPGTSHVSVVDAEGNVVSLTTTIEGAFGSQLMLRGFLLNNELTDFSFSPERDGRPVANRVEPGKRPRSSMAPTIVFGPDGKPFLAIGSPGGSRIIPYVAQAIVGVIDWGLDVQDAISLGHVVNRNGRTELETGTGATALEPALSALGHEVAVTDLNSGLHAIHILADGILIGGADPRREGIAAGE